MAHLSIIFISMKYTSPSILLILSLLLSLISLTNGQGPNKISNVDLRSHANSIRHHTNLYRQLVLRRGDYFNITIEFRNAFNQTRDRVRLEFRPRIDKSGLIYAPLSKQDTQIDLSKFCSKITDIRSNKLDAQLAIPTNASIGVWELALSSKVAGGSELSTYSIREPIYIIFNPWAPDDTVYMEREDERQEYVLNDVGKVYMGTYNAVTGTRWHYGQFSEFVLPGVMMLLDRTQMSVGQRTDVVKVSRAISALMNSHDEMGLLVGNWSGNYLEGNSPWSWSGSSSIFERYVKSGGRPVKFGQCWVFGGLTTTSLRTVGIPARTITNFVSAHDTDLSLTIDQFSTERGEKIVGINGDSIWNFHVWSDAWMLREDLPPEYSGWQAIDATPQETSRGMYQLGPASLEAVKRGKVNFAYDVGFVFSEVNADLVNWRLDSKSTFNWRKISFQPDHVGRRILTKMIGFIDNYRYGISDAQDITDQYKYREGTKEERNSYKEAVRLAGLQAISKKRR